MDRRGDKAEIRPEKVYSAALDKDRQPRRPGYPSNDEEDKADEMANDDNVQYRVKCERVGGHVQE